MTNKRKKQFIVFFIINVIVFTITSIINIIGIVQHNSMNNNIQGDTLLKRNDNNINVNANINEKFHVKTIISNSEFIKNINNTENIESEQLDVKIKSRVNDLCTKFINDPSSLNGINDTNIFDINYIMNKQNELYKYMHLDKYGNMVDKIAKLSPKTDSDYTIGIAKISDQMYIDKNNIAYIYQVDIMKSGQKYTDISITVTLDKKTMKIRDFGNIRYGEIQEQSNQEMSDEMKKLIANGQNSITMNPYS